MESGSTGNPRGFHCLEQGDLQEMFRRFKNMYYGCITVPVQTLSTAAVGETTYDHLTLTLTLTRTLWDDQCLDAVACEGSRLIRATWFLCVEILLR